MAKTSRGSLFLVCVISLAGCGCNEPGSAPSYCLTLDTREPALGKANEARLFLGQLQVSDGQSYAFWGTKNSDGSIDQISESLAWMNLPLFGLRTIYDATTGLPTLVYSEADNSAITIDWQRDRAVFSGFDDQGRFVAAVEVTRNAGSFVTQTLKCCPSAQTNPSGSARDASETSDAARSSPASRTLGRPVCSQEMHARLVEDAVDGSLFGFLGRIDDIDSLDGVRTFGKDLLRENAEGVVCASQGLLALAVIPVLVGPPGTNSGLAVAGATAIASSMVTKTLLADAAAHLAGRIESCLNAGGSVDEPAFAAIAQDLIYAGESCLVPDVEPDDPADQPTDLGSALGSELPTTAALVETPRCSLTTDKGPSTALENFRRP